MLRRSSLTEMSLLIFVVVPRPLESVLFVLFVSLSLVPRVWSAVAQGVFWRLAAWWRFPVSVLIFLGHFSVQGFLFIFCGEWAFVVFWVVFSESGLVVLWGVSSIFCIVCPLLKLFTAILLAFVVVLKDIYGGVDLS